MRTPALMFAVALVVGCGDDGAESAAAGGEPTSDTGSADASVGADAVDDAAGTGDAAAGDAGDATAGDVGADAATLPPTGPDLVVLTFNIKADDSFGAAFNDATSWNFAGDDEDDRRDRVVATLDRLAADLVCLQEARPEPVAYLIDGAIVPYAHHGAERGGDNAPDDMNGLLYRTDRLTFVDGGHFWLSDTPDAPGTTFVFHDDAFEATEAIIDRWRTERGYPSDHYPVRVVLEWRD